MNEVRLKLIKSDHCISLNTKNGYDYLSFVYQENEEKKYKFEFSTTTPLGNNQLSMFETNDIRKIRLETQEPMEGIFLIGIVLEGVDHTVIHHIEIVADDKANTSLILAFFNEVEKLVLRKGGEFNFNMEDWLLHLAY